MKGATGVQTRTYGVIIPYASKISRFKGISKGAKKRLRWVDYYLRKDNARATCRHFDISPSLFYKWYNRFLKLGLKGLEERSRKPKRFRESKIPLEHVDLIRVLRKKYPYFSKYKLAVILKRDFDIKISASTIGRVVKKYNLFFVPKYKPKKERYRHSRNRLPKGFKAKNPGDLVQGDTKHVSFFGPKRYFYVITDCLTKITSIRVSASPSSRQSKMAIEASSRHFPYQIKNFQNDNGSENLKEMRDHLKGLSINQYFSRPRTPQDNSFVERMIGTIEKEFIQQGKLTFDIEEQQKLIDDWLEEYHRFRPHQALNHLTPYEFYEKIKNEKCTRCTEP